MQRTQHAGLPHPRFGKGVFRSAPIALATLMDDNAAILLGKLDVDAPRACLLIEH